MHPVPVYWQQTGSRRKAFTSAWVPGDYQPSIILKVFWIEKFETIFQDGVAMEVCKKMIGGSEGGSLEIAEESVAVALEDGLEVMEEDSAVVGVPAGVGLADGGEGDVA